MSARQQFLADYRTIRSAEGRGSQDSSYYRALPYRDLSGKNSAQWTIRGKSYRYFEHKILAPLERETGRPLDVLDLGAGNCWLSYRLSLRKHNPVALDIFADAMDGLQASRHYDCRFPLLEAEFDHLPFRPSSFDLAIFNASIHYSTDYRRTLGELRRCLRPNGHFVIIDSPIYQLPEHGEQMRAERHDDFEKRYGFRSDAMPSLEYFDEPTLAALAAELQIKWSVHRPWYGWKWWSRPWKARLEGRRPPSRFWILDGVFV
ncbi:MAG: class I SAM-dependent methyltransferase [Bryobacteraceae bacterium]|jgi:SAM-dependent methyltransferase